ncbi:AraC family transcriptional regulator ligand-binding domain-containing protein [Nocardioides sp.]|uniref:AraC family transcriptional regulator ligand-binding domain-containing protein n=1 Tax=Nocardioides sp. TaxID=35761 RepID=UPI00271CAF0D|nr:AraC family transcriptional regulator ligand-binding domain-containing protein [Nocardioides sp.]MDO9457416.1 AraC family transcriptional regulator ligand-binding domain-containing protein [Nocardioides sp.]
MRLEPAADDWTFARAAAGIVVLCRYGAAHGLGARRCLAGTGLAPHDLDDPDREVTAAQELRVVRTLRRELGEVGLAVGATYRAGTFGAFGFAVQSSRTVLDAMATAAHFIDLSFAFAIPSAEVVGDLVVVEHDGAGLPRDVRRFLLERDAEAVRQVLDGLVPGGVGAVLEVGDERARVTFGADQLDRPLPDRSAEGLRTAEEVCRDVVDRRRARTGLAADVRVLVTQRLRDGAPMADVAGGLGWTERTLRRRLAAEGVGYRELVDEVRSSMAAALTAGRATLPVAELAGRLGYGSAPAYLHARARWADDGPGRRPS